MRVRTIQRSKMPFHFCNGRVTRTLAVAVLAVGFCLGQLYLSESEAQPLDRGEAQDHSANEVKPGQTVAPIGNSGYMVPIPEIKMRSIIGNKASRPATVPSPKEQSSPILAPAKNQPSPTKAEKPGTGEHPSAAEVPNAPDVETLPFEPAKRRSTVEQPSEPATVQRPSATEYRSPLAHPPATPEDVIAAPTPKKQLLGKKVTPTIPPLLVLQPIKVASKAKSLGWIKAQDEAGSKDQILLDPRREPEVIPDLEPEAIAKSEPVKEPEQDRQKASEKSNQAQPLKEARQELLKTPEREVLKKPLREAEQDLRNAPEQAVHEKSLKEARQELLKTPEREVLKKPLREVEQDLRNAPEQAVHDKSLKEARQELLKTPEKEVQKEPLKEALLSPEPEPVPAALTPPEAEQPAEPEESPLPVEKPAPPVQEIPPSPLAQDALNSPRVKQYLRETAPLLEELSLLMTKAPSLNLADYDPSDANAPMVPKDIYLKMDSMKRELQNLDSKTFAIIPPPKYIPYHAVIRQSITETYEACDAIISYLNERNDENLKKILEHLTKARELIRQTRTVQG